MEIAQRLALGDSIPPRQGTWQTVLAHEQSAPIRRVERHDPFFDGIGLAVADLDGAADRRQQVVAAVLVVVDDRDADAGVGAELRGSEVADHGSVAAEDLY